MEIVEGRFTLCARQKYSVTSKRMKLMMFLEYGPVCHVAFGGSNTACLLSENQWTWENRFLVIRLLKEIVSGT